MIDRDCRRRPFGSHAASASVCRCGFFLLSGCVPFGFCLRLRRNGSRCALFLENLVALAQAQVLELPQALALVLAQTLTLAVALALALALAVTPSRERESRAKDN